MERRLTRALTATLFAVPTLAAAYALLAAPAAAVNEPSGLERRVKSAFLYKFPSYVEWPRASFTSADEPLRIGVAGDDSLAAELTRLVAGRTSGGHPVAVVRLETPEAAAGVHVLYVAGTDRERVQEWIGAARPKPVLIVTDTPRALALGSMINFVLTEGRVRFEVNVEAAERRGLSLSSRLLTVALSVTSRNP